MDTGELKHKIFEYLGSEITERGFVHFNFECEGQQYYHELKNTTLEQYCLKPKAGIPTLAYLGDVDIAKELLEGQTLYMRTNKVRIDDPNSISGYKEVPIGINEEVTVTAVGVGSRAYPVKIVFQDKKGNTYYQPVAISKTNCGMADSDFIMENKINIFQIHLASVMQIQKIKEPDEQIWEKPVYLKAETECLDETDTPVRLPRYTQFTIKI